MKFLVLVLFLFSSLACTRAHNQDNKKFVQDYHHSHKAPMSKTRGYLSISLTEKSRDDETIKLLANVFPNRDFQGSEIHWQLPEKAVVISGDTDLEVDLVREQNQTFEVILDRSSLKEGEKVFVFAYKVVDGERLGTSSSIIYIEEPEVGLQQQKSIQQKNLIQ